MDDVAGDLAVTADLVIPAAELRWRFSRSSGPGGQSVNTADSRVELRWQPAGSAALSASQRARIVRRLAERQSGVDLVVRAGEHRSQWQNRRAARARLAQLVRDALRPPPRQRVRTRPTRAAVAQRLARKRRRGELKRGRFRPAADD